MRACGAAGLEPGDFVEGISSASVGDRQVPTSRFGTLRAPGMTASYIVKQRF